MTDINEEQPTMPQATQSSKVGPMMWTRNLQILVLCCTSTTKFDDTFRVHKKWNQKTK